MAKKKLIRLSAVMNQENTKAYDSVQNRRRYGLLKDQKHDDDLLLRAEQAWNNKLELRRVAERCENYTFDDDQWGDIIEVDGEQMTEREYIRRQGNVPLSDNIMISIFSTITGLYDKQGAEPTATARDNINLWLSDMMSATMQCNWQNNKVSHTLSLIWRTFLLSGVACARTSFDMQIDGVPDVDTRLVSPYKLFWEAGTDPNMRDLTLIGQLCDVSKEELYRIFAKPEYGLSIKKINAIYNINDPNQRSAASFPDDVNHSWLDEADSVLSNQQNDQNKLDYISFRTANTPHTYRVIEVWTTESRSRIQCWDPIAKRQEDSYYKIEDTPSEIAAIERINNARRKQFADAGLPISECPLIATEPITDTFWQYTFFAPDGTILCSGESPYDHHSHPFTLLLYPYVNGKVYPYMSYVIPQQRNLNRLNIMNDLAIRSTTKGLTIYPEEAIPDDMTPDEFDRQLTSYRGVVRYKMSRVNPNARPDIITSNAANLGIPELMQMKINLMQQVANTSGALQGKTPSSGTAASRYAMEAENSTTSLFTLINDFSGFTEDLGMKQCELIKQFYEHGRLIFSKKGNANMLEYDRLSARDMKFIVSIKESAATAAYMQRQQEKLNLLFEKGMLDVLTYLDNSGDPLDTQLADSIRRSQAQGTFQDQQFQVPGADQQQVAQAQQTLGFNQSPPLTQSA